jgi:hypothetical protein
LVNDNDAPTAIGETTKQQLRFVNTLKIRSTSFFFVPELYVFLILFGLCQTVEIGIYRTHEVIVVGKGSQTIQLLLKRVGFTGMF